MKAILCYFIIFITHYVCCDRCGRPGKSSPWSIVRYSIRGRALDLDQYGDQVDYLCNSTNDILASSYKTRHCVKGKWFPEIPKCGNYS